MHEHLTICISRDEPRGKFNKISLIFYNIMGLQPFYFSRQKWIFVINVSTFLRLENKR